MIAGLAAVTFRRGERAVLDRVTLAIAPAERVAIVGPNGAGKTTLLRLLLGLERPSDGQVHACRSGGGYVPQAYGESLFPWFSVLKNVAMARFLEGRRDALECAGKLCARLLPDVDAARPAGRLSGGEKQTVAIMRALSTSGEIVVVDEPFSAMSSTTRTRVVDALEAELGERALLLVSHDPRDSAALCQRAVTLEDGRLLEGKTRSLPSA